MESYSSDGAQKLEWCPARDRQKTETICPFI